MGGGGEGAGGGGGGSGGQGEGFHRGGGRGQRTEKSWWREGGRLGWCFPSLMRVDEDGKDGGGKVVQRPPELCSIGISLDVQALSYKQPGHLNPTQGTPPPKPVQLFLPFSASHSSQPIRFKKNHDANMPVHTPSAITPYRGIDATPLTNQNGRCERERGAI